MPIRGLAALQSLALAASLGFVSRWRLPGGDLAGGHTIYPGWLFLLLALAISIAAFAAFTPGTLPRGGLTGGAAVVAAMAAGTGVVAWKHWQTVFGSGELYPDRLNPLRQDALGVATTAAVAGLAGLAALAQEGCFAAPGRHRRESNGWRVACLVGGPVLAVGLPVTLMVVAGDGSPARGTAAALIYGLPWGVAAVVASRLVRSAAVWVLAAGVVAAAATAVGPQMTSLFGDAAEAVLAGAAAVLLALLVAAFRVPAARIGTQS